MTSSAVPCTDAKLQSERLSLLLQQLRLLQLRTASHPLLIWVLLLLDMKHPRRPLRLLLLHALKYCLQRLLWLLLLHVQLLR